MYISPLLGLIKVSGLSNLADSFQTQFVHLYTNENCLESCRLVNEINLIYEHV